MKNILSLDTATKCGMALYKKGQIYNNQTWNFSKYGSDHGKKYTAFYNKLVTTIERERITEIVAEDIYEDKSRLKAFVALGEMRGIILLVADEKNLPVTFIEPTEHKRNLTGDRYASKEKTMRALNRLGYTFKDDNAADAISIMLCYLDNEKTAVEHPNSKAPCTNVPR